MSSLENQLVLFLGADGSGKSTGIELTQASLDPFTSVAVLEQTKSPALRAFKRKALSRHVDAAFINEREELFERSNHGFASLIGEARSTHEVTLLDGHPLITAVSHDLMREIIGAPGSLERHRNPEKLATDMSATIMPTTVVYFHVDEDTRRERITSREDPSESLWGFNAPFFLNRYQGALLESARATCCYAGITLIELDTGLLGHEEVTQSITEMIPITQTGDPR